VLDAYGWADLMPLLAAAHGDAPPASVGHPDRNAARRALADALLERLVALNLERATEEARGLVRWLRPAFQQPGSSPTQTTLPGQPAAAREADEAIETSQLPATKADKHPWPPGLPEQVALVARVLAESPVPLTEPALAARFSGRGPWKKRLPQLLETLVALGRARRVGDAFGSAA